MKNSFWWLLLPVLAIGALIYYLVTRKTASQNNSTIQTSTNSQTGIRQWFPGWNGFTASSLNNQGAALQAAENLGKQVSNLFGFNDGGNNPGVPVSGSNQGGIQSSGAGAGVPMPITQNTDIWDASFNNADYAPAPLNNYDVLNTTDSVASQNQTDTGISSGSSGNPFASSFDFGA